MIGAILVRITRQTLCLSTKNFAHQIGHVLYHLSSAGCRQLDEPTVEGDVRDGDGSTVPILNDCLVPISFAE